MGRVRSVYRLDRIRHPVNSTILSQHANKKGYLRVCICKDGISRHHFVHRLVAAAFIANENNLPQVNHKDENPANNCVDNLEWCTPWENMMHNGHNRNRAVIAITKDGHTERYKSSKDASDILGITQSAISQALNGKNKTAGGREWFFND